MTSASFEFRVDREMVRPSAAYIELTLAEWEGFDTFEMSVDQEILTHDDPVVVEVPDEVTDEISESDA